ncbi:MAG: glycosyltransferase, partial [Bdellovibrionales bacterium]|nr:glycosyltransferase [Bdellovibrionales bacterium]
MKPRLQLQEFTSPQVFRLSTSKKGYGGIIYEKMLDAVLSSHFDYTVVSSTFGFKGIWRLLEMPKYLFLQWKFAKKPHGLRIRSFQSALFNFKGRGISIIYHVDSSGSAWLPRLYQDLTEWVFKAVIRKSEHIVVIAKYWQDYFRELGYT